MVVADHLQREIGLHAGADVEVAVVEQRPAAVRALDAAQIDGDLALRARRRPARRDSAAAARIRPEWWRRPRARTPNGRRAAGASSSACVARVDAARSSVSSRSRSSCMPVMRSSPTSSAARLPERIAPSMVAGRPVVGPVAGQHQIAPARSAAPGRLASCAGVAAKVARRSRTICHGGRRPAGRARRQPRCQIVCASIVARRRRSRRSAALMVTDRRPGKANIHSAVPLSTPRIGGRPAGGAMRKCALTMARNSVGTVEVRHQRRRDVGRHREDDGVVGAERDGVAAEIERRDAVAGEAQRAQLVLEAQHRAALLADAPAPARSSVAPRPSRAISGRQARPPAASVSRMTARREPRRALAADRC